MTKEDHDILQNIINHFVLQKQMNSLGDNTPSGGASTLTHRRASASERGHDSSPMLLQNPKFWYEKIREKDQEITRLKVMVNEAEGKKKAYDEIATKRQKEIERMEFQFKRVTEEADFL